jgi:hypothetical protein
MSFCYDICYFNKYRIPFITVGSSSFPAVTQGAAGVTYLVTNIESNALRH